LSATRTGTHSSTAASAYLDEIEIREGNDDATVMSRRILEGENMINGDQPPPPAILRSALAERKDQIQLVPSGGARWIAMNTTIPPFDDIDVRRAVIAGFNREAMRLTYGGKPSGDILTHFLPPGIGGFNEAGGLNGHGLTSCRDPAATSNSRPTTFAERDSRPAPTKAMRRS
jgi:peptide/nickel transport system substrate-binding protein